MKTTRLALAFLLTSGLAGLSMARPSLDSLNKGGLSGVGLDWEKQRPANAAATEPQEQGAAQAEQSQEDQGERSFAEISGQRLSKAEREKLQEPYDFKRHPLSPRQTEILARALGGELEVADNGTISLKKDDSPLTYDQVLAALYPTVKGQVEAIAQDDLKDPESRKEARNLLTLGRFPRFLNSEQIQSLNGSANHAIAAAAERDARPAAEQTGALARDMAQGAPWLWLAVIAMARAVLRWRKSGGKEIRLGETCRVGCPCSSLRGYQTISLERRRMVGSDPWYEPSSKGMISSYVWI